MARRLGKRKAPSREKHVIRERDKVDSGIFDERTMITLSKFYNKGIIAKLESPIARGKEADIYMASPGASELVRGMEYVIIKFFRVETTSFRKMADYMIGDPRFTRKISRKKKLGVIEVWCRKEYGNLEMARSAGALAPKPLMHHGSILAMEFIGDGGIPAPRLRDVELRDPEATLKLIMESVRRMYKKRLVHADLSEFNILIKEEGKAQKPYLIDFGQAVVLDHPNAREFLIRDVRNITDYFAKRYGTGMGYGEAIKSVTS